MRRGATALAAVAAIAAAGDAAAAGGPIRTGEHGGFSRVVMTIDPGVEWSLELGQGEATVLFPGRRLDFTTEAVWRRIPRRRVTAIEPAATARGTEVQLGLGCACRVTATLVSGRYLAIDVHDAAEGDAADMLAADAPGGWSGAGRPSLALAEEVLLNRLGRAADQGLIEFADTRPPAERAPDRAEPVAGDAAGVPAEVSTHAGSHADPAPARDGDPDLLAQLGLRHPQIAASSVYDRDARAAARGGRPLPHRDCRPDEAIDLAAWSDGRSFPDQAGELRRRLVGEFDRPDPEAARDLARLHLRYGLGAEAALLLRAFGVTGGDAPLLADLALLFEGKPPQSDLARDIACPGRHGLLLALAGRPAMLQPGAHRRSIRQSLEEMPATLRILLAPRLVERFLAANEAPEARLLYDIAARTGERLSHDMHLAAALLAAAEGQAEEAERMMAALVAANAPNKAQAVLALARTRLERGGAAPAPWVDDLRTLAVMHRRTPVEEAARSLLAEALARNGDIGGALATAAALGRDVPEARAAAAALAPRLLAEADPAAVGAAAYAGAALGHGSLLAAASEAERVAIADGLLGLGLPEPALALVAPEPEGSPRSPEARLASSRALLALDRAEAALADLEGLESAEAAAVRARALARTGDFAAAAAALAGQPEALSYAWAAGDWERAAGSADPAQAAMAAYMSGRRLPPPEGQAELTPETAFVIAAPDLDQPSLRSARTLLATGREVGGFIEAILAAFE
jgi:hypothetical protein